MKTLTLNNHKTSVDNKHTKIPWAHLLPSQTRQHRNQTHEPDTATSTRQLETGHAINVKNFNALIEIIKNLGSSYTSSNPLYTLTSLEALYIQAIASLDNLNQIQTENQKDIDLKKEAFKDLKKYATRSKNIFMVSGVPPEVVLRCNHINSNIQGKRIKKITDKTQHNKHISVSHQSCTQQIKHVEDLIQLFKTYPQYNPPAELSVAAWTTRRNTMKAAQQAVIMSEVNLKIARLNRNRTLYKPTTGLVDIALGVKKVVLGSYGSSSPQYHMLSSMKFRTIPDYKNL